MCSPCLLAPVDDGKVRAGRPAVHARDFVPEPTACRAARRFVGSVLAEAGVDPEIAQLLVSELVGNAVRHGQTPVTVRVSVGQVVRVEVHDGNAVVPTLQAARGDDEAGRGLMLLDAMATRWGVDSRPDGKVVWFEHGAA